MSSLGQLREFFWPSVKNDDYLLTARKRMLNILACGAVFGGTISNVLSFEYLLERPPSVAVFLLIAPFLFIIPPLLIQRKEMNFSHVAHLTLAIFFVVNLITAFTGSGFFSLGSFYLAILPPVAVLMVGLRGGAVYMVLTMTTFFWFYLWPETMLTADYDVTAEMVVYWNFVGLAMMTTALWVACFVYQRGMTDAANRIESSRLAADAGSRAKSEFLANMSHEIRTPLNGVLGMAQVLKNRDLGKHERAMVETIQDSGNTLLAILNDVLDLSKIESGRTLLSPDDDSLYEILGRLKDLFTPLARDKRLKLMLRIDPEVPDWVHIDSIRIRQCVSNLISNAVKFTEKGGVSVRVMARPCHGNPARGHFVTVTVTDTGIGIEPDKLSLLFQAFAQADASISRRFGGTGLGLSVARNLARQMGGDITVKSTPRVGSRFTFTFVAEPAKDPRKKNVPQNAMAGRRLDGIQVMVVDDQPVNRQVARIFLEEAGASVTEAEHGRQALDLLETQACDLMLLDVHMPVMDGIETITRLRSGSFSARALPVIALTADAMSGTSRKLLDYGMDYYLSKPVDRLEMIRAIRRVLATRRAASRASLSA